MFLIARKHPRRTVLIRGERGTRGMKKESGKGERERGLKPVLGNGKGDDPKKATRKKEELSGKKKINKGKKR